jgi:hypothetical protein
MTDDKAIVLEDDEANQSLNEESADNALDNFLARAESGAQESDLNILGDNFLGKIDKNSKPTSKGTLGKLSQEPAFSSSTAKVLPKQTGKVFSTKNLLPAPKPSAQKYPMTSVKLNAVDTEDTRRQLEDKDIEIMKLETQLSGVVGQKDVISYELTEARKRIVQLEASRDKLEEDLQVKDSAVQEALLSRKAAEVDSQNKTRLLKERQELASRSYVNSAIENQKRVYESEIERRNLKIEMLEANLKAAEDRLKLS